MTSLVHELVNMASTPGVSTGDLLRRSLVIARRLAVPEAIDWINCELTGYRMREVPDYRRLHGQLKVKSYNGWVPFFLPVDMTEKLAYYHAGQSIPELQQLISGADSSNEIICSFEEGMEAILIRMVKQAAGTALQPALVISPVQVEGVIETVRSRILDWALDLEGQGIIGEGMTFTMEEKKVVQAQHYHFGDVSGSQIQIGSNGSTQNQNKTSVVNDVESLRGLIDALGEVLERAVVSEDVIEELNAELATLRAQAASPKPKWEIIKMTARAIKVVAEGAAGNILGELAKPHVQTLLALAGASVGVGG
ncbi:AbiTii domain-containing protein [Pseudomonas sp. Marseille-P9899]|uniref:AbiTii domain-containing protein n=1 Tax=Pseudomonas sp. Marseille-P9899 TaxID=2730401 RepID=UPI00158BBAC7|nr:hypothetical protein [Pseudomonas sp. Marseille-P9899]